jgi:hypothetical protein
MRPVREQLEHDKVIRLLQLKYKKKFEAGINPGSEQTAPVGVGPAAIFPDVVLQSTDRNQKLMGVVEVETGESVNNLEAMSQWVAFTRLQVPFHLYVPAGCVDSARRLAADHQIKITELWTYHSVGDQVRFTMIERSEPPAPAKAAPKPAAPKPAAAAPPPRPAAARPAAARPAAARPAAVKPAAARRRTTAAAPPPRKPAATAAAKPAASRARVAREAPKTASKARAQAAAKTKKTAGKSARAQKRK